jgi:HAMP domain-containing protein
MIKKPSLKITLFMLVFFSILFSLVCLSYITIVHVNAKIENLLEENLQSKAKASEIIYRSGLNHMLETGNVISQSTFFIDALKKNNTENLVFILQDVLKFENLDFALVVDSDSNIIASSKDSISGNKVDINGLSNFAISHGISIASTEIIPAEELETINSGIKFNSRIRKIPTLYQKDAGNLDYETSSLSMVTIIPTYDKNNVTGAIILGDSLNRDYRMPDKLNEILDAEASIFQDDLRISTTELTSKGTRFIGTTLPEEIYNKTILKSEVFLGRVWVINHYGRASYIPIKNYRGKAIGLIELSVKEDEFKKSEFLFQERELSSIIIITTIILILVSSIISYFVAKKIADPINALIESSIKVSEGDFEQGVKINSFDEINKLAASFNIMVRYLRKYMVSKEREIIDEYKKGDSKERKNEK